MGHQDYFLAPLPGSEALLESGIGKGNFYCKCCFYFCPLLYSIMLGSPFDSLFGGTAATAKVVDDPPPAQLDPFKIPMKIVVLWITSILEMELSILVIIYSLFMNYASCSSVQVFQRSKLRGSCSLYH